MANLKGFDPNEHEPRGDFDAIPAGSYTASIVAADFQDTKNGRGKYLKVELQILDGQYKGRKLWDRLNLQNENEIAVKIAKQALAEICVATKVMTPNDTEELKNIPLTVVVKCVKREDTGEISNEIKHYKPRDTATKSPSQPAGNEKTAPWAKK